MTDKELNEVLKRATAPEREPDYWERFPSQVTAEIQRREQTALASSRVGVSPASGAGVPPALATSREKHSSGRRDVRRTTWTMLLRFLTNKPAFAIGVATVCVAFGFLLGFWRGQRSPGYDPQLAEAQKYFQEIAGLFPNQLQAIVFDQQGAHLVLAQEPNVPASPPIYLKVRGPKGCQRFVTFSGQQIRVNGDVCDVLADHQGNVLVVGHQLLWSGAQAHARSGPYQIEARTLENRS
jgi:hypothetical protein